MARKATAQDVADLAGVSRTAVSLVLNGRAEGIVAPAKQVLIREAAQRLRYRPDPVALSLRTRRTTTLGCLVDLSASQVAPILAGVSTVALRAGYQLVVLDVGAGEDAYAMLEQGRLDGVVIVGPAAVSEVDIPVVHVDVEAHPGRSSFLPDLAGGARAAVAHVAAFGHRLVGVLTEPGSRIGSQWRGELQGAGLEVVGENPNPRVLLDLEPRPTAIACSSELAAVALCLAATERGLRVPGDLSVLGFDGSPRLGPEPWLTSVRLPWRELGEQAAGTLLEAVTTGTSAPGQVTVLPAELVVGTSTDPY